MKYSSKAQIQSKIILYLLVSVVILLLLIFAFISIKRARERFRELEQKRLENEIWASLEEIEYGSVEKKKLTVPEGTKEICFIDITKRSETLKSPILKAKKYKRMRNIIQSGEKKDIFFLMQQEPYIVPIYVPGICFDHYPYYACFEPRANILNIFIEGKGRCSLVLIQYKICEDLTGKYEEDGKTTKEEISFGSVNAKLTIPAATVLQPAPEEICIEAVSYIGVGGLVSEIYNITPEHITSSAGVKFNLRYEDFLLPPNADPSYIKIKKKINPWFPLDNTVVEWDYHRISGDTQDLTYVAVFGPEMPTANITITNVKEDVPEGAEVIVAKDIELSLDGSLSNDPDNDIASYDWDFGDETTGTGATLTHAYTEIGSYNLTLTVTDLTGYHNTKTIVLNVVNDANQKNIPDDTIIITSNPDWRKILSLVPLTIWKDISIQGDCIIPYLAYHKEGGAASNDFMIGSLKTTYNPDATVLHFGSEPLLAGQDVATKTMTDDYFNYWTSYEDIVVVDYNNQDDALMASLFAAFINAPIIFVNSNNQADYETALNKPTLQHAYIIGSLEPSTNNYIRSKTAQQTYYTLADIKNSEKNPYQKLSSKITLTS